MWLCESSNLESELKLVNLINPSANPKIEMMLQEQIKEPALPIEELNLNSELVFFDTFSHDNNEVNLVEKKCSGFCCLILKIFILNSF